MNSGSADPDRSSQSRDAIPESGERPARILVVDDEPAVADILRELLSQRGHEVVVAETGERATECIVALHPEVVLTDINLPGMSGLDVMRFARSHDPEAAVIVVTGDATAETAIDALRHGASDFITKPFDLADVHQIIERGLRHRRLRVMNQRLIEELCDKNEILQQHEMRLRERVDQATAQLKALYEVGLEVSANLDLAPRLRLICERGVARVGGAAAIVFLLENEEDDCYAAAWHGVELPELEDGKQHWLGRDHALTPALAEARSVRFDGDGTVDVLPGLAGMVVRSLLAVPMIAEGQVIGVLAVFDKAGGFSADDQQFLELFASQTAGAVRNSLLFEHTKSLDRLKSEFVAVVSHEIRTPLTSVRGAVELLRDARFFQNGEQQERLLGIAHANTERLLVLINDILDLSKLDSSTLRMNYERQALGPVIEQAGLNLRTLIEAHGVDLQLVLDPELPEVFIDAGRIAQVMTNLLSNAIKFSPADGRIEVVAKHAGGQIVVSVRDQGEGIAARDLSKLFLKFSQIDSSPTRKAGGAGLGLAICKGIVDRHGGRMWVESAPGEGSTFLFALPPATLAHSVVSS